MIMVDCGGIYFDDGSKTFNLIHIDDISKHSTPQNYIGTTFPFVVFKKNVIHTFIFNFKRPLFIFSHWFSSTYSIRWQKIKRGVWEVRMSVWMTLPLHLLYVVVSEVDNSVILFFYFGAISENFGRF